MELFGRAEDCARIDRLLADARNGRAGALVVRGEPGVGKSALLAYAQGHAAGLDTLRTAGVEAESGLPFAALHALLRTRIDLLERIPEPQARALGAALALGPAEDADRLAANAGALSLLAEASEGRPLLVVVDDAQWLDRSSSEALVFAARRLAGEAVAFLFAASESGGARFEASGLDELVVEGLDEASALALLRARSGALAPAVAELLVSETHGNPLALLELPALLSEEQLAGGRPIERPLPIGREIGRAFLARVHRLPSEAQRALLVAAAGQGAGMQAVSAAAVALGCSPGALEAAEAAGLVRLAADDLVFRHPLVRAAVYHAASPAEQRAAHAALAAVLEGDRRAWQLAAAAAGADEVAAEALQEAAERAGARGSFALQLQALERAVELSVDGDARVGRLLAASRAASGAGEHARALELVELALPQATHPLVHADLRHQQAAIALAQGLPFSEDAVFEEAHRVEPLDAERAAGLLGLILAHRVAALDTAGALELAERREALSSSQGTLGDLLTARTLHGDARAALELLPGLVAEPERAAEQAPSLILLERYGEAQLVLAVSLERARSRGRPREIAWLQACQALLELRTGRLAVVLAAASEARVLAEELGAQDILALAEPTLAVVAAIQGRAAACREHAAAALALGEARQDARARGWAGIALGLLALGAGRPEEAVVELEPVAALSARTGVSEPGVLPYAPDLIEAYARAGDLAAAHELLERFTAQRKRQSDAGPWRRRRAAVPSWPTSRRSTAASRRRSRSASTGPRRSSRLGRSSATASACGARTVAKRAASRCAPRSRGSTRPLRCPGSSGPAPSSGPQARPSPGATRRPRSG